MSLPTNLCGGLRVAREALCVASTHAEWPGHQAALQECLDTIDRIGVFSCPEWSKYAVPELPDPGSVS